MEQNQWEEITLLGARQICGARGQRRQGSVRALNNERILLRLSSRKETN
jgi:hypothetical protein